MLSPKLRTVQKAKTVSRNSPTYSFGESKVVDTDPDRIGEMVLSIWNDRVFEN